ncbi:MAG: RnfABCDGE type electron transport complex subunit G [Clostridia bacterium]
MKEFAKLAGTLGLITFIAAALLGGVNAVTKDKIAAIAVEKRNNAMQALLSDAEEFSQLNDDIYEGRANGEVVGYCVSVASAGYGGDINMMVGIKADATLAGIEILSNGETAGLGANCTKEEFKSQFAGLDYPIAVVKGAAEGSGQISAITGATITSNAVAKGVNSAYENLVAYFDALEGGGN